MAEASPQERKKNNQKMNLLLSSLTKIIDVSCFVRKRCEINATKACTSWRTNYAMINESRETIAQAEKNCKTNLQNQNRS